MLVEVDASPASPTVEPPLYHNMLDQSAMFRENRPPWLDGLGDWNGRERKGDLGESGIRIKDCYIRIENKRALRRDC